MSKFMLKDSGEYYLSLSEQPKRFDADSITNVFFDDTNGQVFSVRSGGVTGVTVTGMDESKSTSFRMEDKGPIVSIKFSPDNNILAIQRNTDNQLATVEFANFKDLTPTNVEYSHTCKWKNAKILGFVWPKINEIAFITDHGIEMLQVLPEKKQLKSLKNISFSGAWFSWCSPSSIVLLASNNGALLQPFSLSGSSITKLQKLELESARPLVERDVFILRVNNTTWCAVFKHGATVAPAPTEVWLYPISGSSGVTHVLKTGLLGRFAVNVVDDLIIVHHQSSQSSQIFDIMDSEKLENNTIIHVPLVPGHSIRPPTIGDQLCPMYSATWVVFQPDYIIDARLGCLWKVNLVLPGLAHSLPKDQIASVVAVLLRRSDAKPTIYKILNQLVSEADVYLVEISKVFDEINAVLRKWTEQEVNRCTSGVSAPPLPVVLTEEELCSNVLAPRLQEPRFVAVATAWLRSAAKSGAGGGAAVWALLVAGLAQARAWRRLSALCRRLGPGLGVGLSAGPQTPRRAVAPRLLALAAAAPSHAQLALDLLWAQGAHEEVVEVLLGWGEVTAGAGASRQAGAGAAGGLAARKLLPFAQAAGPSAFRSAYHALAQADQLKGNQIQSHIEYYKQITED